MKKALIFYISEFSGHFHAASAIEKGLEQTFKGIQIKKINALEYTNPILEKIINKAYLEVIKKKPHIWGNMYDNPDVMKKTKKAREVLHKFNMSKIKKLLDSYAPDVVLCTQAFPCGMVADYKACSGKKIPLVGVLTDHAPHLYWIFNEVDYYIVPFAETAEGLKQKKVSSRKIKVYGIPIDPKFSNTNDPGKSLDALGFSEKNPTILLMGGSQGLGGMTDVVKAFLKDDKHNYQLIVVTGSNKKLNSRLKKILNKNGNTNIKILSYVDNIDELMDIADVIVTKAGGMTIAEALVKKLPILLINPIPGHERRNADLLIQKGVAVEIKDYHNIYDSINNLFEDKDVLQKMKRNIGPLAKPHSAMDIAELLKNSN